jgi:hypothetical protein
MFELLFRDHPALFIPCLAIGAVGIVFATWLVMHYTSLTRRREVESALKQDMINRGFTPVDIERVLQATSEREPAPLPPGPPEVISANEYAIIEKMLDEGHTVDEIERVIRAIKGPDSRFKLPREMEV